MKKYISLLVLTLVASLSLCFTSLADVQPYVDYSSRGWVKVGNKWKYNTGSGGGYHYTDCLVSIDGKSYIFDNEGYMIDRSPYKYKDKTYTIDGSGAATIANGWVFNGWWYIYKNGSMKTNTWTNVEGTTLAQRYGSASCYYVKSDGKMAQNETLTLDGKIYAFDNSGKGTEQAPLSGWVQEGQKWRYYENNSYLKNTWISNEGFRESKFTPSRNIHYYLGSDGYMYANQTSTINGTIYYFDASGVASTTSMTSNASDADLNQYQMEFKKAGLNKSKTSSEPYFADTIYNGKYIVGQGSSITKAQNIMINRIKSLTGGTQVNLSLVSTKKWPGEYSDLEENSYTVTVQGIPSSNNSNGATTNNNYGTINNNSSNHNNSTSTYNPPTNNNTYNNNTATPPPVSNNTSNNTSYNNQSSSSNNNAVNYGGESIDDLIDGNGRFTGEAFTSMGSVNVNGWSMASKPMDMYDISNDQWVSSGVYWFINKNIKTHTQGVWAEWASGRWYFATATEEVYYETDDGDTKKESGKYNIVDYLQDQYALIDNKVYYFDDDGICINKQPAFNETFSNGKMNGFRPENNDDSDSTPVINNVVPSPNNNNNNTNNTNNNNVSNNTNNTSNSIAAPPVINYQPSNNTSGNEATKEQLKAMLYDILNSVENKQATSATKQEIKDKLNQAKGLANTLK